MKTPKLDELFLRSPNAYMVVDRDLRYVAANDAYLKITASTLDSLLGKRIFDAFPNDPGDPNNDSALMLRKSFERVLETGRTDVLALIPYRVPEETPNGPVLAERYWSATHTPILDEQGRVAFIFQHTVDITELQRLRQAASGMAEGSKRDVMESGVLQRAKKLQDTNRLIDEERRRLLALFEQAPGFMAVLNGPEHTYEMYNLAYMQITGHRDLLGKPIRQALPELEGQGFYELLDRVYTTGTPFIGRGALVKVQVQKDGPIEDVYLDFIYQPIRNAAGQITGIFVQGHDVTEQRHAVNALQESEARVRELNSALERRVAQRTKELEEVNAELESFSYSVSHDLRAPLRHIAGFAQLLERHAGKNLDEVSRDYLQTISDSAKEGGRLVDELLAFSRTGRAELKLMSTDLSEVVADVQKELAPETEGRTIRWSVERLPEVQVDPTLMRAALKNLLANAVKYTRRTPEALIEVGGTATDGEVHVWVRDNGVGFDMRYVDKLFGVFQRLHSEEEFEGTGIGLANVRRIITRHGGRVWAESRLNEGATFHLTLPWAAKLSA